MHKETQIGIDAGNDPGPDVAVGDSCRRERIVPGDCVKEVAFHPGTCSDAPWFNLCTEERDSFAVMFESDLSRVHLETVICPESLTHSTRNS